MPCRANRDHAKSSVQFCSASPDCGHPKYDDPNTVAHPPLAPSGGHFSNQRHVSASDMPASARRPSKHCLFEGDLDFLLSFSSIYRNALRKIMQSLQEKCPSGQGTRNVLTMCPEYTLIRMARPTGMDGGCAASLSLRSAACRATSSRSFEPVTPAFGVRYFVCK